jgi:hypothetical protein
MSKFLFGYRIPSTYAPGSGDVTAAWAAWFEQLGASVVDRGNPIFERSTIGNCGPDTALGGYSLVDADDLQSAVALAKRCPSLLSDGGVEIGEITTLNSDPSSGG